MGIYFYDNGDEMRVHRGEIQRHFLLNGRHNVSIDIIITSAFLWDVPTVHAQKRQFLILRFFLKPLVLREELVGGLVDIFLFDSPELFKLVDDFGFLVESVHDFFPGDVVQS